ncbi:MAG: esterase-like activity of phytase family protein [Pseudomonadota bacterium]
MTVALASALPAPWTPARAQTNNARPIAVKVRPLTAFARASLGGNRYGKLIFKGGLVLSSADKRFGGFSDIAVDPDGKRFLAVSDDGLWLGGSFSYKGGLLRGINGPVMGPLLARSGRRLRGKRERDAEGLVLASGTLSRGTVLISFERIHRIGRFGVTPRQVAKPRYITIPRIRSFATTNKGLEAIAVLRAGRRNGTIVAIAERKRRGGDRPAWLIARPGAKPAGFSIRDRGNMDITSAAGLPNGDLLLLERRFRWSEGVRIRLRQIKARDLRPGRTVDGEVLLRANLSYEIDNMEGLAVHVAADGTPVLTLISDDNFNTFLQRTLVLQFAYPAGRKTR